jgi:hypothetical protein
MDRSFFYCHRNEPRGLAVFAGAPTADGTLRFGLSVWDSHGFNIGIWGIASRSGPGWEYRGNMNANDPHARCDVLLRREADNSLAISSVGTSVCGDMTYGGSGTDIETLRFDPSTYAGPVTWELEDADTFFNHAGTCARAKKS